MKIRIGAGLGLFHWRLNGEHKQAQGWLDVLIDYFLRFTIWCQSLTLTDTMIPAEEVLPPLDVIMVCVTQCVRQGN